MDFLDEFKSQFSPKILYEETEIDLNKKLQDTRHALQESTSENDQLSEIILQLYAESRVENVATTELLAQISNPMFRNMPLPRNADDIPLSEKAGYVLYYLKFLGYTARKTTEEYHVTKEHLDGMHKSIKGKTASIEVKRTGSLKVPELDGQKEIKRSPQTKPPPTPPITPPKLEKAKSSSKK